MPFQEAPWAGPLTRLEEGTPGHRLRGNHPAASCSGIFSLPPAPSLLQAPRGPLGSTSRRPGLSPTRRCPGSGPPRVVHPGRAPAGLPLPARLLVLLLQGRKALPPLPVLLRRRLGHQLRLVAVMAARGRGEAKGGVSAGGGRYRPGAGAAGVGTC